MAYDLPLIWAAIIAFAILAYIVLDGFDLGIGILFLFTPRKKDRDMLLATVAPVWDGNETWLVLGGGGLFAVFPLAYSILMPALYMPIILMLFGLVFRGVALEFRSQNNAWDWGFALGSLVASLAQGLALGVIIQGIPVSGRAFAGSNMDWLSIFGLVTGFAVAAGYTLLGSCWVILKTEGSVQDKAYKYAPSFAVVMLLCLAIVSIWTPFLNPASYDRWLGTTKWVNAFIPALVIVAAGFFIYGIRKRIDYMPILAAEAIFILSYIGIGRDVYPYIVPPTVTIWEAAAPENSLLFLLVGSAFLIPIVISYNFYAYWVFRGKVTSEASYHQ